VHTFRHKEHDKQITLPGNIEQQEEAMVHVTATITFTYQNHNTVTLNHALSVTDHIPLLHIYTGHTDSIKHKNCGVRVQCALKHELHPRSSDGYP
jgi:hypothetical protein